MKSTATTVENYLAELPDDRREAIEAVRAVILKNLDPAIVETVQYGMIGYAIPHEVYPAGYHCDPKQPLPFLSLASQKNHMSLYLFCLYCGEEEVLSFQIAWEAAGKKLDMGKSCVRFKKLDDVPLDVVGKMVKRMTAKKFIKAYEESLNAPRPTRKKTASKKATPKKKVASKKTPPKKTPAKKTTTRKKTSRQR